jgi:hypothetical protein
MDWGAYCSNHMGCSLTLYAATHLSYVSSEVHGQREMQLSTLPVCGCWFSFFYTFISQMIGDFGPSQVGQGASGGGTTIITTDDWNILTTLCLANVDYLSTAEQKVLGAFGAARSILVTTYGFLNLLWLITTRRFPDRAKAIRNKLSSFSKTSKKQYAIVCFNIAIPVLTVP